MSLISLQIDVASITLCGPAVTGFFQICWISSYTNFSDKKKCKKNFKLCKNYLGAINWFLKSLLLRSTKFFSNFSLGLILNFIFIYFMHPTLILMYTISPLPLILKFTVLIGYVRWFLSFISLIGWFNFYSFGLRLYQNQCVILLCRRDLNSLILDS